MARKKIQKAPKSGKNKEEASVQDEEQVLDEKPKPTKASKKQKQQTSLFTQSFNNRIDKFKNFYSEFIQLKGSDDLEEFDRVIKAVADDMEKACAKVLENDLVDAGDWIEKKITEIKAQIQVAHKTEQDTKNVLQNGGIFSEASIEAQLNPIRLKAKELEERLEEYESFQKRAKEIGTQQNKMDEE